MRGLPFSSLQAAVLVLAAVAILAWPGPACAATIDVPADQPTIAAGLAAASPGDSVRVACGTYFEHDLIMPSGVTLCGAELDADCVVIDAQQQGRVLRIENCGADTRVAGLTLTGGLVFFNYTPPEDEAAGAGIYCLNSSPQFYRIKLIGNDTNAWCDGWGLGGGLYCRDSAPYFLEAEISGNECRMGGGAYCLDSSPVFEQVLFSDNRSRTHYNCNGTCYGGGLACFGNTQAILVDVVFAGNAAGADESVAYGGGMYCSGGSATLTRVRFQGNIGYGNIVWATFGGGMACTGTSLSMQDVVFDSNRILLYLPYGFGAGLYCTDCQVSMIGGVFRDNLQTDCYAQEAGGAVYFQGGAGLFRQVTFCGNGMSADYPEAIPILGGNLYSATANLTLDRCIVAYASHGDGIYADPGCAPELLCCDVYGNPEGDFGGDMADPTGTNGNISADPRFCDLLGGDLTLAAGSPCLYATPCGLIGYYGYGCAGPGPYLTALTDVPNDQGRQLRLRWDASLFDSAGSDTTITGYAIWRRIDERTRGLGRPARLAARLNYPPGEWDYVATIPARGESEYHTVVPTLCDSTDAGACWSIFFVSALTEQPLLFFDSPPDSGYSVDNLAPSAPAGVCVAYEVTGNQLNWTASAEEDLRYYRIYRNGELAQTTIATAWTDPVTASWWAHVYRLAAVDFAGNESELAAPDPDCVTGVEAGDAPGDYVLLLNRPNPFNPMTTIGFGLPQPSRVRLGIYDLAGRRVRALLTGAPYPAGWHRVSWDGKDDGGQPQATGVYFYRLETQACTLSRKMTLLR